MSQNCRKNAIWLIRGGMRKRCNCMKLLAEREGFEPPEGYPSTVFKTAAFDHSATSPRGEEYNGKSARMCLFLATIVTTSHNPVELRTLKIFSPAPDR